MLALYRLTGDAKWLRHGEYLLSILSFYQQVWDPPQLRGYLYGGFGVMNTDGEWNDGRQARFVSTYADYYQETGEIEYLERAVAACRAAFALMDMAENHENGINDTVMGEKLGVRPKVAGGRAEPGMGYAGENIYHRLQNREWHGGRDLTHWTGMNWSAGGGLAAAAYLERLFGAVWVDGAARVAVPIDGVAARVQSWDDGRIALEVRSALANLERPFVEAREITVKFGRMRPGNYDITINGKQYDDMTRERLQKGVTVRIPGAAAG
jgi:hypothetical protein